MSHNLSLTSIFSGSTFVLVAAREGVLKHTWTDLTDDEILLRRWDMNMAYGPCTGLTRYTCTTITIMSMIAITTTITTVTYNKQELWTFCHSAHRHFTTTVTSITLMAFSCV
jgi:kynureninase